jgi:hypothetical protein
MSRLRTILLLALSAPLLAAASGPAWMDTAAPTGKAPIVAVARGAAMDYVILGGGWSQGLRRGMVLHVGSDATVKGRLLLAEVRADRAVALILDLDPDQSLSPGDLARRSLFRL